MRHPLPPLEGLKVFEAAARQLSFSAAARELCLSKGAVSHQIARLEREIGAPLFRRAARQVYLSEAGQQLQRATLEAFAALQGAVDDIRHRSLEEIRLAATTYVAARWLSPRLASWLETHPETRLQLQHAVNDAGFRLDSVDLAVRWCFADDADPHRQWFEAAPLFPVIAPALLDRLPLPGTGLPASALDDGPLGALPLLCEDRARDLWADWLGRPPANPRRTVSDANVRVQAAIDGQGLMLADRLMAREIDSGLLIAPFGHSLNGVGYGLFRRAGAGGEDVDTLQSWITGEAISGR